MNRGVRALGVSLVIWVVAALAPAAASALTFTFNPSSLAFGSHGYLTSTSMTTMFTVACDSPPGPDCAPQGTYDPSDLAMSPDSYSQTNNCGSGPNGTMQPTFGAPVSCTITVTFSPLVNGSINGSLNDANGEFSVPLSGSGFGAPQASSPGTAAASPGKKCKKKKKKKKRAAESKKTKKKKCKKKKKGKKKR